MNKYYIYLILISYLSCIEPQASQLENEPSSVKAPESSSSIMPKYGNWCGPGYPKNIETAGNPIDALDIACQEHDYCYAQKGYLSCKCDSDFNEKIVSGLMNNNFEGAEKFFARSFRAYFKSSPCIGNHKDKIAPSRAVHQLVKKVGSKTVELVNKIPFIGD